MPPAGRSRCVIGHFRFRCRFAPAPIRARGARDTPTRGGIIGLWTLDETASDWKPPSPMAHTLEFRPDGSIVARNIPDIWDHDNRRVKGGYDSGVGTWSLAEHQGFWTLRLNLSEVNGKVPGRGVLLHLAGQSSPYQILAVLGDPDEGRSLVFQRSNPSTQSQEH